jgi:hypothetical protein
VLSRPSEQVADTVPDQSRQRADHDRYGRGQSNVFDTAMAPVRVKELLGQAAR